MVEEIIKRFEAEMLREVGYKVSFQLIYDHASTVEMITEATSRVLQITIEDIRSKSQKSELVEARQIIMYIASEKYRVTKSEIGRCLDLHHTTVVISVKRVRDFLSINDAKVTYQLKSILKYINKKLRHENK